MAVYSIKDLQNLSGIKAHTLRVWEQRYKLIEPSRTKTNIRFYEDHQLKLILNIAILNRNGFKISKIASMEPHEIEHKVEAIADVNFSYDTQVDALSLAMMNLDEWQFDKILSTNIRENCFEQTMTELVFPFLDRLSLMWLAGSVTRIHEHFITNLFRQKLNAAIDATPIANHADCKKFLLYLPEDEPNELILLFMHYLLKIRKFRVIYLGVQISQADIMQAVAACQPDFVFSVINENMPRQSVRQYVESLCKQNPQTHFWLTGYQLFIHNIESNTQLSVIENLGEVVEKLGEVVEKLDEMKQRK